MDHSSSLKRLLACLLLSLACFSVLADDVGFVPVWWANGNRYTSASAACASSCTGWPSTTRCTVKNLTVDSTGLNASCSIQVSQQCNGDNWCDMPVSTYGLSAGYECPENSHTSASGSACTCSAGMIAMDGKCAPNPFDGPKKEDCGDLGKTLGGSDSTKYTMGPSSVACYRGCLATPQTQYGSGNNRWASGPWYSMGESCNGTGTDGKPGALPQDQKANACASGTCPGSVNGQDVCVACSWNASETVTKKTNTDGSTTVTETNTTDNGDGSATKTTTQTTYPPGTNPGYAQGGAGAGGAGSGSGTGITLPPGATQSREVSTGPKASSAQDSAGLDCSKTPNIPACKVSSWSGVCGSFNCDGDAVSCAMAREQYTRNCQLFDTPNEYSQVFSTLSSDVRPSGHPGHEPTQTPLDFQTGLDQTNPFGDACPQDQTFTVAGGSSFVIPWSQLCDPLRALGDVMVAICLLGSVAIVFRGGK